MIFYGVVVAVVVVIVDVDGDEGEEKSMLRMDWLIYIRSHMWKGQTYKEGTSMDSHIVEIYTTWCDQVVPNKQQATKELNCFCSWENARMYWALVST